jgi:hypothetical protein
MLEIGESGKVQAKRKFQRIYCRGYGIDEEKRNEIGKEGII